MITLDQCRRTELGDLCPGRGLAAGGAYAGEWPVMIATETLAEITLGGKVSLL